MMQRGHDELFQVRKDDVRWKNERLREDLNPNLWEKKANIVQVVKDRLGKAEMEGIHFLWR